MYVCVCVCICVCVCVQCLVGRPRCAIYFENWPMDRLYTLLMIACH